MNKSFIFSCLLALTSAGVSAQTEVTPYTPGITPEGITYYLPRTGLRIRITATCVKYTPGDFRQYSERYLRLGNIPKDAATTWKIDDVKIFTEGVPRRKQSVLYKTGSEDFRAACRAYEIRNTDVDKRTSHGSRSNSRNAETCHCEQ